MKPFDRELYIAREARRNADLKLKTTLDTLNALKEQLIEQAKIIKKLKKENKRLSQS